MKFYVLILLAVLAVAGVAEAGGSCNNNAANIFVAGGRVHRGGNNDVNVFVNGARRAPRNRNNSTNIFVR